LEPVNYKYLGSTFCKRQNFLGVLCVGMCPGSVPPMTIWETKHSMKTLLIRSRQRVDPDMTTLQGKRGK